MSVNPLRRFRQELAALLTEELEVPVFDLVPEAVHQVPILVLPTPEIQPSSGLKSLDFKAELLIITNRADGAESQRSMDDLAWRAWLALRASRLTDTGSLGIPFAGPSTIEVAGMTYPAYQITVLATVSAPKE